MDKKNNININNSNKILIFIPAYNVEKKVFKVVDDIQKKIFVDKKTDILIINDNSKDKTKIVIEKIKNFFPYKIFIMNNKKNLGYGGVQKRAFKFAIKKKYKSLIMLHGDGQYTPKKILSFTNELKKDYYDGVFGTRMWSYKSAIKGGMPIYKFFGNIFLTKIQNFLLHSSLSEFHSGYRSYKVSSLRKINFNKYSNNFHFDTEIIIDLLSKKMKIKELPIPTIYKDEVSHLKSIPYGLNILKTMIKYKLNNIF